MAVHEGDSRKYVAAALPYRTQACSDDVTEFSSTSPFLFLAMEQIENDSEVAFLCQIIPELALNDGMMSLISKWDGQDTEVDCKLKLCLEEYLIQYELATTANLNSDTKMDPAILCAMTKAASMMRAVLAVVHHREGFLQSTLEDVKRVTQYRSKTDGSLEASLALLLTREDTLLAVELLNYINCHKNGVALRMKTTMDKLEAEMQNLNSETRESWMLKVLQELPGYRQLMRPRHFKTISDQLMQWLPGAAEATCDMEQRDLRISKGRKLIIDCQFALRASDANWTEQERSSFSYVVDILTKATESSIGNRQVSESHDVFTSTPAADTSQMEQFKDALKPLKDNEVPELTQKAVVKWAMDAQLHINDALIKPQGKRSKQDDPCEKGLDLCSVFTEIMNIFFPETPAIEHISKQFVDCMSDFFHTKTLMAICKFKVEAGTVKLRSSKDVPTADLDKLIHLAVKVDKSLEEVAFSIDTGSSVDEAHKAMIDHMLEIGAYISTTLNGIATHTGKNLSRKLATLRKYVPTFGIKGDWHRTVCILVSKGSISEDNYDDMATSQPETLQELTKKLTVKEMMENNMHDHLCKVYSGKKIQKHITDILEDSTGGGHTTHHRSHALLPPAQRLPHHHLFSTLMCPQVYPAACMNTFLK